MTGEGINPQSEEQVELCQEQLEVLDRYPMMSGSAIPRPDPGELYFSVSEDRFIRKEEDK